MIINFYENGLIKKIDSSIGDSGQEFLYDENFTKLIKHELFYTSSAKSKTNHFIGFVKDYANNFPSHIIYSPPQATNLIGIKKNITFQNNIETIEIFSIDSPFNLKLTSKISNFYDPKTQLLVKSIKLSPSIFKNGDINKIEINYNTFGKTSLIHKYGTTQFEYKNNELIKEVNSHPSRLEILYSDYQYDNCNNWISRKVIYNKQIHLENRNFTYYEKC